MKLFIKKVKGIRGFVPDSWWVFDENNLCVSTFLKKSDAEDYVRNCEDKKDEDLA